MTYSDDLNFVAFSNKSLSAKDFTQEQLNAAEVSGVARSTKKLTTILSIIVLFFFGLPALLTVFLAGSIGIPALIIVGVFFWAIIWGIPSGARAIARDQLMLLKFSQDNGLSFSAAEVASPAEPIMINTITARTITDKLDWPDGELTLADCLYNAANSKDTRGVYIKIAQIRLPHQVPHLLLHSRGTLLRARVDEYHVKRLELEGDFGKYFELYVPPDYQIDALQIFTPDVMAALIDAGSQFDYELVNDCLYIYMSPPWSGKREGQIRQMLRLVDVLAPKFSKQAQTYSDMRVGAVSSGLVAASGAHLENKYSASGLAVETIILAGAVTGLIMSIVLGQWISALITIIIAAIVIADLIMKYIASKK